MSENLKTSRYQNGDAIPYIVDNTTWSQLNTGAWCYNNHDAANNSLYGKLYNWYTISDLRGVCPVGWHIPTELEWNILNEYLGGNGTAPKLKSREGWRNSNATGESGFNALPSGFRDSRSGTFDHWGLSISNQVFCIFWANQNSYPGIRYIYGDYPNLNRNRDGSDALGYFAIGEERTGGSIRCIKN